MLIPEAIARHLPDSPHVTDDMGCSGANVLLYPDRVLKIQPEGNPAAGEHTMLRYLQGRLNVPRLIAEAQQDGARYLLMSRIPGRYLCDEGILDDPPRLARLVAKALRTLWAADITDCPCQHTLDHKFAAIECALRENRLTIEAARPYLFMSPAEFPSAAAMFDWVVAHRPATEDLVLSHGDCCLPNIFVDEADNIGFIDLGLTGVADRWCDIGMVLWSMWANTTGQFGGKQRPFDRRLLFDALGMEMDEERLRYYEVLNALY